MNSEIRPEVREYLQRFMLGKPKFDAFNPTADAIARASTDDLRRYLELRGFEMESTRDVPLDSVRAAALAIHASENYVEFDPGCEWDGRDGEPA